MIKKEIFFIYFFLLLNILCQNQIAVTQIQFTFQRTIYVKTNNKTKVIPISTSSDTKKNDIKLFITEKSTNKSENYIQCGHGTNDTSIFHCTITTNGTYYFRYKCNDENYQYLRQKVYVYNSIDEILTFKKSRDTNCYYHNEIFSYTLTINKGVDIDYSKINVYAYYPKSLRKNVSQPISILLYNNYSYENVYFFDSKHTMNQYYIKVTENKDFEDPLGVIDSINFTNVRVDDYFYPDMGKIRFIIESCNFKPQYFILKDKNEKKYKINCGKSSTYYDSKSLFCYFNEKINYYGPMKIYYGDGLISDNIFSSKTLNQIQFSESDNDIITINGSNYLNYTITLNEEYKGKFYMNSINKGYINFKNVTHNYEHIFERDINSESDKKLNLNEDTFWILIKYERGYNWTALRLERRIFEDENIQIAASVYYDLKWKFNDILDKIYFDPDIIVLKNPAILSSNYFSTKLIFENTDANNKYGNQFCYNYNGYATKTFNCTNSIDNYKNIKLIDGDSPYPGYLPTQLIQFTNVTKLKIFKFDVLNYCQSNIFGAYDNLENATINVYFPIDGNKTVSVKYNGIDIEENNKALIYHNPFDYTFKTFVVSRDLIKDESNTEKLAEIYYDNSIIATMKLTFANVVIPPFIQRHLSIDRNNSPSYIKVQFIYPMTIGLNEVEFRIRYSNSVNDYRICTLENDHITLTCPHRIDQFKNINFVTNCNGEEPLDLTISYIQK